MVQSEKWSLNTADWKKIGKGACIALGGALLAYIADLLTGLDVTGNAYAPLVVALGSVLVNAGMKYLAGKE